LDTFGQYGIAVNKTESGVQHAIEGPASILFRVLPGRGVEPKKLIEKSDALKLALKLNASQEIRFAIDEGYMTIDVPKLDRDRYFVDAVDLWSRWKRPDFGLKVPLGEDRFGKVVEIDFTSSNSPHLLIGGTTGSGKSEALNTILGGLIEHYSPREVRLQLIDPKGTELQHLSNSEHVDGEIGWDEQDAIGILSRAVDEMQVRMTQAAGLGVDQHFMRGGIGQLDLTDGEAADLLEDCRLRHQRVAPMSPELRLALPALGILPSRSALALGPSSGRCLANSIRAIERAWTSSGPSASRSVRWWA